MSIYDITKSFYEILDNIDTIKFISDNELFYMNNDLIRFEENLDYLDSNEYNNIMEITKIHDFETPIDLILSLYKTISEEIYKRMKNIGTELKTELIEFACGLNDEQSDDLLRIIRVID